MFYQPCYYYTIELPLQIYNCFYYVKELYKFVFPWANLYYLINNPNFFWSRVILTWQNDIVKDLNHHILQDFLDEKYLFESINQADYDRRSDDNTYVYELPIEFF